MFRENIVVLKSNSFDIGNTGANVVAIPIPFKCSLIEAVVVPEAAATANFTVSLDSLQNATAGAADLGSITVPASAAAFTGYYDLAGEGVVLNRHSTVLVQVDDAGDSGENAHVMLVLDYLPENTGNDSTNMIETA